MTRFFLMLTLFTAAVLVEVSILPNIFNRALPLGMMFFIISLYVFDGPPTVYYAIIAGSIFFALHGAAPIVMLVFALLSLVSVLFKQILTHRSAQHLLFFLTVNLIVWQLFELARRIVSGGPSDGPFMVFSRMSVFNVAWSFGIFLCISCVLFMKQVRGNRRGNLTI